MAQTCTHTLAGKPVVDALFYEQQRYTIKKMRVVSPFVFFFLVSQRLDALKNTLPIHEGGQFSKAAYDQAASDLDASVKQDGAFGQNSPIKLVVTTANLENCDERPDHRTVDVVYHVFSTDPLPSIQPTTEAHGSSREQSASAVAERNTQGRFKLTPLAGYNYSYRGFAGGEAVMRVPGKVFRDFHFTGLGSASTLLLSGEFNGEAGIHRRLLDTGEYHVGYQYDQSPAQILNLTLATAHARFTGTSKPFGSGRAQTSLRYGLSLEQGTQQSNFTAGNLPPETIANSHYGATRLYAGTTSSTRYSETAASYGLEIGGAGLSSLSFVKQVGEVSYSLRFPGETHLPWDMQVAVAGGAITGGPILVNERFFGGNVVSPFIPGAAWTIPNGPLVRSITANYLSGAGFGGTSFYSTNLTVGKVVKSWPLIPTWIENSDGFGSGIAAAENTAEGFFFDDNFTKSDAMKKLTTEYREKLKGDVDGLQAEFAAMHGQSTSPAAARALKECERQARLSKSALGNLDSGKLRELYGSKSRLVQLRDAVPALIAAAPDADKPALRASGDKLREHLKSLQDDVAAVEQGPVGQDARTRAHNDMARPREVVDTLRHEANMLQIGVFGIFDTGRLWPDVYGTRYAYGGGVRLSVVNVNFNVGYAVNPDPQPSLKQGRGAVLLFITYTNLFR